MAVVLFMTKKIGSEDEESIKQREFIFPIAYILLWASVGKSH
jgi:hypothetical protein